MDPSLDARLDAYPDLPPDERAGLRAQIDAARPDLRAALADAEALARVLDGMQQHGEDERLAELTAAEATGTLSASEQTLWEALKARAAHDVDLRARLDAVQGRVAMLGTAMEDPLARFARMTGANAGPVAPREERPRATPRAERPALPAARRAMPRWTRGVLAAAAVLVVMLGGLRVIFPPSPYAFTDEEVGTQEFGALRGTPTPSTDSTEALYLSALERLERAQRSFFGQPLAPDPQRLTIAAGQLEQVVQRAAPGSFVYLEAAYRLAKARLLLGDAAAARPLLTEVVQGQGRFAPEAAVLLERAPGAP